MSVDPTVIIHEEELGLAGFAVTGNRDAFVNSWTSSRGMSLGVLDRGNSGASALFRRLQSSGGVSLRHRAAD